MMRYKALGLFLAISASKVLAANVFEVHNDTQTTTFNNSLDPYSKAVYFTEVAADFSRIVLKKGLLTKGKVTSVASLKIDDMEVDGTDIHLSPDGNTLLYVARQPLDKSTPMVDHNIFISRKTASGWTTPDLLPQEINSRQDEFYPSMTDKGDIYFVRRIEGQNLDIFVSRRIDGHYQPAERLHDAINTPLLEGDVFVSPDERFLLFARMKAEDSMGMTDLYISYRDDNTWTVPVNMGPEVNSKGIDGSPFVSRDNQWLYFTSSREAKDPTQFGHGLGLYRTPLEDAISIE